MTNLQAAVDSLHKNLAAALDVEKRLAELLERQADAMLARGPAAVVAASRALDAVYAELKQSSDACRSMLFALDEQLPEPASGGTGGATLQDVVQRLPDPLRPRLEAPRAELRRVRAATRKRSARNAALARAQLDALAAVRGIVDRASGRSTGTAKHASAPLSRLDAHV